MSLGQPLGANSFGSNWSEQHVGTSMAFSLPDQRFGHTDKNAKISSAIRCCARPGTLDCVQGQKNAPANAFNPLKCISPLTGTKEGWAHPSELQVSRKKAEADARSPLGQLHPLKAFFRNFECRFCSSCAYAFRSWVDAEYFGGLQLERGLVCVYVWVGSAGCDCSSSTQGAPQRRRN